jgi:hypothetical protein
MSSAVQHAVRKFVDAGTRGRIIIISSMGGMLTAYGSWGLLREQACA